MKKSFFIAVIINLLFIAEVQGQEIFNESKFGFAIEKPSGWIEIENHEIIDNLEKFELTDENLVQLIDNHKGSVLLTSYYKYNPKLHSGLIPTIQVNVRVNTSKNFEEFFMVMNQSAKSMRNYFDDFTFDVEPKKVIIDNKNALYFVGRFTMQSQNGTIIKVRSRTYAIPYGNYFFQINFTDGQIEEDNTELFDSLLKTIKIGKK